MRYKPRDIEDLWNMERRRRAFLYGSFQLEFERLKREDRANRIGSQGKGRRIGNNG